RATARADPPRAGCTGSQRSPRPPASAAPWPKAGPRPSRAWPIPGRSPPQRSTSEPAETAVAKPVPHLPASGVSSASSAGATPFRGGSEGGRSPPPSGLVEANGRIEPGIAHVDQKVHGDDDDREEQHGSLDHRVVPELHRIEHQAPHAGLEEDHLDDHRAAQQDGELLS